MDDIGCRGGDLECEFDLGMELVLIDHLGGDCESLELLKCSCFRRNCDVMDVLLALAFVFEFIVPMLLFFEWSISCDISCF